MTNPVDDCPTLSHGGDIAKAQAQFGGNREDWLDLSTGINPAVYPFEWPALRFAARLPQRDDMNDLLAAASEYYGVKGLDRLVAAPGTQALIQLVPRLFPSTSVGIVGPTYEEHLACWRRAGHRVEILENISRAADAVVVIVVNPNNPTGTLFAPGVLLALREKLARKGGLLIVDEAFADVTPDASIAGQAHDDGLLILRSFGKFFGLAGMRLGFGISAASFASKLRDEIGPWAVSGPAIAIGAAALADRDWIETTRLKLAEASRRLDALLVAAGIRVVGGTSLFRLAQSREAVEIANRLAQSHILVRSFPSQPQWLRFGLPRENAEFERLEQALAGYRPAAWRV